MSISFKHIIHKIDRAFNPRKYYTDNISKKITKLSVGDKIYAMYIPKIDKHSALYSLTALDKVELAACTVSYIQVGEISNNNRIINLKVIIKNINKYNNLYNCTHYEVLSNKDFVVTFTLSTKGINDKSFTMNNYSGYLIFATDKKIIKSYLKPTVDVIKYKIAARILDNEQNNKTEEYLWTREGGQTTFGQHHIIGFKQQYAKLIQQLRLM